MSTSTPPGRMSAASAAEEDPGVSREGVTVVGRGCLLVSAFFLDMARTRDGSPGARTSFLHPLANKSFSLLYLSRTTDSSNLRAFHKGIGSQVGRGP